MRRIMYEIVLCGVLVCASSEGAAATLNEELAEQPGIEDASTGVPDLIVELPYATTKNFIKRNVYGDLSRCFLNRMAVDMLKTARAHLKRLAPTLRFIAFDCLRPRRVQLIMWDVVKGTPEQSYVANPHSKTGSVHNYGCAIDMSLADKNGTPVAMGTDFDYFGRKAQPRYESNFLGDGTLSHEALANRLLLRHVMVAAGFYTLSNEWWHFNCVAGSQVRRQFKIVQ